MESERLGAISGGGASPSAGVSASALHLARVASAALAALFAVVLVVTTATDGSPFRGELLTPWMNATLVDFYLNVLLLSVWVWLREARALGPVGAATVILYLCCLGSFATWSYVAHLLWFRTRPGDSLAKIVLGA